MSARVLCLAGPSEAGKSTAGIYYESLGARRIKIRSILLGLKTGEELEFNGVRSRYGFDYSEFIAALRLMTEQEPTDVVVVESFIDPPLTTFIRRQWDGYVGVIFVNANFEIRAERYSRDASVSLCVARERVKQKDERKGLPLNLTLWRTCADYWLANDGSPESFRAALKNIWKQQTHQ